jgi:hypothetical protein
MTDTHPFVADVGTIISIGMDYDCSTVTDLNFHVRKPDGSEVDWIPNVISGGRILEYTIESGDLDIAGVWTVQPWVEFSPTEQWSGDPVQFTVYSYFSTL